MKLDLEQVEKIIGELLNRKDYQSLFKVLKQLEVFESRIKIILYEVDEIVRALQERDLFHEDGKYDA